MTKDEGIKQIDEAQWELIEGSLNLFVTDAKDRPVHAWLQRRPHYCDRGHIQLNMDMPGQVPGIPELDEADSFPRYFFGFEEADRHTRAFLKWRIWKTRTVWSGSIESYWDNPKLREEMRKVWEAGDRRASQVSSNLYDNTQ